jgi:hypothetical protein
MMQRESEMQVELWNRTLILTDAQVTRLQDFILEWISKRQDGRESVSYLVSIIRQDMRVKFPTRQIDAESMFEALGFKLDRAYAANSRCIRATYVTL